MAGIRAIGRPERGEHFRDIGRPVLVHAEPVDLPDNAEIAGPHFQADPQFGESCGETAFGPRASLVKEFDEVYVPLRLFSEIGQLLCTTWIGGDRFARAVLARCGFARVEGLGGVLPLGARSCFFILIRKARKPIPSISYQEIGSAGARRLGTLRQYLAMGIDLSELPRTDNIQLITVQFPRLVDGR